MSLSYDNDKFSGCQWCGFGELRGDSSRAVVSVASVGVFTVAISVLLGPVDLSLTLSMWVWLVARYFQKSCLFGILF